MNSEARQIIAQLNLAPLPREGGYFRVIWTSATRLPSGRATASAIYFLLTTEDFSALHRLKAEELWHFHAGDAVEHAQFDVESKRVTRVRLGREILAGDQSQLLVRGRIWQGARLAAGGRHGWALVGCTVSPAWDDAEFELAEGTILQREFPGNDTLIRELTR